MKKDDLEKFDGKDGNKSYVSYQGKVYDVSDSRLWKNGKHVNRHAAGMDLTEAMESAPHGPEVLLDRFKHVDTIEGFRIQKEKDKKDVLKKLYKLFHPHPMLIHFPMGLLGFVLIMHFLFLKYKEPSFELASFYALVTSTIFLVPTIASGILSWWLNYALTFNTIFKYKLIFSFVLLAMCIFEVAVRFAVPTVVTDSSGLSIIYNFMLMANIPVLAVIGFHGGKLSWG